MREKTRPVLSMTGFGESAFSDGQFFYRLYLYSVNHRFLDLAAKLPSEALFLEAEFKKSARAVLRRGRVSLVVEKSGQNPESEISIDKRAAGEYVRFIRETSADFGFAGEINPASLLALPGVVSASGRRSPEKMIKKEAIKAMKGALEGLVSMRTVEGASIGKSMMRSVEKISGHSESLSKRAEVSGRKKRRILEAKIREAGLEPSAAGFASEIANLVNRLDITEEINRLNSHLGQFSRTLAVNPSGIKLDFILQELLRETNTIAAKSQDIHISRKTIEIKTEIQILKEQVQNIE